jgi:uncharacterized damage-inducible protein DinB
VSGFTANDHSSPAGHQDPDTGRYNPAVTTIELMRNEAELAYQEIFTAVDGVTEAQAWAVLPQGGPDYLHTDGSIQGIVLHVAGCKKMYGSIAFRETEVRWRNVAEQMERFEPSWPAALTYLRESQDYWMSTWSHLTPASLLEEVPHFRGALWPAWKIIRIMIHHDSYHAGQIAVLRYALSESTTKPPRAADDIRNCCAELASW